MTSFSSKKHISRQPGSFKSLVILLSIWIGHSVDRALFPPKLITPVVVSSLLYTLTWPSLLFLSPLFLTRTPTQTTPVLKLFFPTTLPYNSLTSTPVLSETLLLILAPGPSLLTSFETPLTLLSLETSMLTTQRGMDSFPLTAWKLPVSLDHFLWSGNPERHRLSHAATSFHWEPFIPRYFVSSCVSHSPL